MLARLRKFLTKLFRRTPKGKIVFENYDKRNFLVSIIEIVEFDNQEINNFFEDLEHYNQSGVHVEVDEDIIIRLLHPRTFRVNGIWLRDCLKIFINRQNDEILFNYKDGVLSFDVEKIKEIVIE